jgi:hypothetical protein
MNERTQELYAKACLYARDKHFEDKDVPAFIQCMSKKFAELIVKECAIIANRAENTETEIRCMYDVLTEHFGVE